MQRSQIYNVPKINGAVESDNSSTIWENTSYLKDGRPMVAQAWEEDGYTFITYYLPTQDLEEYSENQLLNYLIQQDVKIPPDINELRVSILKFYDMNHLECWSITIVVGGVNS
ncbi:MAG: hypothetical protein K0S25_309 [Bacillus sp. (in: firmicutes)]|nr:hypothetical protein [Bacillus sp. (in: firmicutes)]